MGLSLLFWSCFYLLACNQAKNEQAEGTEEETKPKKKGKKKKSAEIEEITNETNVSVFLFGTMHAEPQTWKSWISSRVW